MPRFVELEKNYRKFSQDLSSWLPEGIIQVDIELLQRMNLLHYYKNEWDSSASTHYFQVIDTQEKITLENEEFIVWIVPMHFRTSAVTYTLIASQPNQPHLEIVFATAGVYNSSRLILRILEKYLSEIRETEQDLINLA